VETRGDRKFRPTNRRFIGRNLGRFRRGRPVRFVWSVWQREPGPRPTVKPVKHKFDGYGQAEGATGKAISLMELGERFQLAGD